MASEDGGFDLLMAGLLCLQVSCKRSVYGEVGVMVLDETVANTERILPVEHFALWALRGPSEMA